LLAAAEVLASEDHDSVSHLALMKDADFEKAIFRVMRAAEAEFAELAKNDWFPDVGRAPAEIRAAFRAYLDARRLWIELCLARACAKLCLRKGVPAADVSRNLHLVVDLAREGLDQSFTETRGTNFMETWVKSDLTDLPKSTANLVDLLLDRSRNAMVLARLIRLASAPPSDGAIYRGEARDLVLTPADLPTGYKLVGAAQESPGNYQHTFAKGVIFGHSPGVTSDVTVEPLATVAEHSFQMALQAHAMTVPEQQRARQLDPQLGDEGLAQMGTLDGKPYLWAAVRCANVVYRIWTHGVEQNTALDLVTTQVAKWNPVQRRR
jgi:hypothetical protein